MFQGRSTDSALFVKDAQPVCQPSDLGITVDFTMGSYVKDNLRALYLRGISPTLLSAITVSDKHPFVVLSRGDNRVFHSNAPIGHPSFIDPDTYDYNRAGSPTLAGQIRLWSVVAIWCGDLVELSLTYMYGYAVT